MKAWVLVALVAACSNEGGHNVVKKEKPRDELKALWGARVKAKLDKVVAAAKAANAAELGAPGDAQLALDFRNNEADHPNAIAVQIDDARSATEPRPPPPANDPAAELEKAVKEGRTPEFRTPGHTHPLFTFQADGTSHVFQAKELLGVSSVGSGGVASVEAREYMYEQLVNAKYVLVVTPIKVQWPEPPSGRTYAEGNATLQAILIEIDTAKPLGGFTTTATSSDKVRVLKNVNVDEVQRKLDKDFLAEASTAIVKGIETRWPGAKTPLHFGHSLN